MTVVSFLLFQVSVGPCHVVIVAKTNMFASVVMFWLIRNSRFIEPQLLIFWPLSTEYLQQLLPCSSFLPYSYFFFGLGIQPGGCKLWVGANSAFIILDVHNAVILDCLFESALTSLFMKVLFSLSPR